MGNAEAVLFLAPVFVTWDILLILPLLDPVSTDCAEGVGQPTAATGEGQDAALPRGRTLPQWHRCHQPLPVSALLWYAVQGENTQYVSHTIYTVCKSMKVSYWKYTIC